jgi:hypothetical protein
MIKKILILLLITITILGYNNRNVIGTNYWSATDTNQVDSVWFSLDKSFNPQILMNLFDVNGTIADDPDSFVFILDAWLIDSSKSYQKFNLFTDTILISADTLIGYDTIPDWYVQMCNKYLLRRMSLTDTMGFESDSINITTYNNRIR